MEYTVLFVRAVRGHRSTRFVTVNADSPREALSKAKSEFPDWRQKGFRVTSIDHFDEKLGRVILDW